MNKLFALASILIVVLASCRPKGGMDADTGYFSITKLKNSIGRTVPEINKFKKTLNVDGASETIIVDSLKSADVAFINEFEINKPAYRNSYAIDSTKGQSGKSTIYTLNEGLKYPVKRLEYISSDTGIITVKADIVIKNLMTTSFKHFEGTYNPDGNMSYVYTITEELLGKDKTVNIFTLERIK